MDLYAIYHLVIQIIIGGFFAVVIVGIGYRLFIHMFRKEITVDSIVLDKQTTSTRHFRSGKTTTQYIIVFDCKGKSISFFTSFWVFDSVKIGEKGALTYKGRRLVSFN